MNTSDLALFVRIAHTGSITASAKQAGITTAAASSALKRLEKNLNVQLFIRTTRQLRITSAGENFLFYCQQALDALEKGRLTSGDTNGGEEIKGELRLSVPSDLGRNIIIPMIDEMLQLHPALSIDLTVSDSISDFFQDKVDLALRYGKPKDSNCIAFHIASIKRITCAAPSYLVEFGAPIYPNDLIQHQCLLYRAGGRLFNTWQYHNGEETLKLKVASNRICNDTDIVRRWAVAGYGICYRSELDIHADLSVGNLIPLLTNYESPPVELYLICPSREQITPAIIVFREMLREKCTQILISN